MASLITSCSRFVPADGVSIAIYHTICTRSTRGWIAWIWFLDTFLVITYISRLAVWIPHTFRTTSSYGIWLRNETWLTSKIHDYQLQVKLYGLMTNTDPSYEYTYHHKVLTGKQDFRYCLESTLHPDHKEMDYRDLVFQHIFGFGKLIHIGNLDLEHILDHIL